MARPRRLFAHPGECRGRRARLLLAVLLVAVGAAAFVLAASPHAAPDVRPLEAGGSRAAREEAGEATCIDVGVEALDAVRARARLGCADAIVPEAPVPTSPPTPTPSGSPPGAVPTPVPTARPPTEPPSTRPREGGSAPATPAGEPEADERDEPSAPTPTTPPRPAPTAAPEATIATPRSPAPSSPSTAPPARPADAPDEPREGAPSAADPPPSSGWRRMVAEALAGAISDAIDAPWAARDTPPSPGAAQGDAARAERPSVAAGTMEAPLARGVEPSQQQTPAPGARGSPAPPREEQAGRATRGASAGVEPPSTREATARDVTTAPPCATCSDPTASAFAASAGLGEETTVRDPPSGLLERLIDTLRAYLRVG